MDEQIKVKVVKPHNYSREVLRKFPALKKTSAVRVLQRELLCSPDDLSKFVIAVVVNGHDEEYFLTPFTEGSDLWANGCADQTFLNKTFKLFEWKQGEPLDVDVPDIARKPIVYELKLNRSTVSLIKHTQQTLPRRRRSTKETNRESL